jgi:hypothetical protein
MESVEHVLSSSIGREFFQTLVSFSFSCEIHMPSRIFTNPYGKQPLIGILCIHFVYYAPILYIMLPFCILCTHYVYVYYASIIFAHHVHHHRHGAVYIISIICSQTQLAIQTSCRAKKRDIDENFYGSPVPGWYHDRVLRNHHCRPFIRSPYSKSLRVCDFTSQSQTWFHDSIGTFHHRPRRWW